MNTKQEIDLAGLILIILAMIPFQIYEDQRLCIGGAIFLLLAFKLILFDSNLAFYKARIKDPKNWAVNKYSIFIGALLFSLSVISFGAVLLSSDNINNFVFVVLLLLLATGILIISLWKDFAKMEKAISIITFVLPMTFALLSTTHALIEDINEKGFSSALSYTQTILFVLITLGFLSLFIRALFEVIIGIFDIKSLLIRKHKFYVNVAITLIVLIGGYSYITVVSQEGIRDFLIMLGVLLSIWLAISE